MWIQSFIITRYGQLKVMIKKAGIVLLLLFLAGCASMEVTGYRVPGQTLSQTGKYYIAYGENDDHGLHSMIQREMEKRGLKTKVGFKSKMPRDTDYLVEYAAQWQWDITWYLLNFNVRISDPKTNLLIANGSSLRTSLVRKPPEVIVAETMEQVFK